MKVARDSSAFYKVFHGAFKRKGEVLTSKMYVISNPVKSSKKKNLSTQTTKMIVFIDRKMIPNDIFSG